MAIAFDAVSSANSSTAADVTIPHTPVGTPAGVVVLIAQTLSLADEITGVTYGGVALTETANSPYVRDSTNDGVVYAYFLGSSVPSGAQNCVVGVPGTAVGKRTATVVTLTASGNTEIQTTDIDIGGDGLTDVSGLIALGSSSCFVMFTGVSGENLVTSVAPLAGWGSNVNIAWDSGTEQLIAYSYDTVGTADVTYGWTQSSDSAMAIAVAIKESAGGAIAGTGTLTTGTTTASGTGSVAHTGTGSLTTAVTTASGSGTLAHTGTGAPSITAITASGTGTLSHTGTGALTLADVTASGVGTLSHTGTGAVTIGNVTASGSGSIVSSGITGTGEIAIGNVALSGYYFGWMSASRADAMWNDAATESGTWTEQTAATGTWAQG